MINYQDDFSNQFQIEFDSCQHNFYSQSPLSNNDQEFYQIHSQSRIENMDSTNLDNQSIEILTNFDDLLFSTQQKNYSTDKETPKKEPHEPEIRVNDDIKGDLKIKKKIFKLKQQTVLPGESKNLPKCYARQLKLFIENVCNKTKDPEIKKLKDDQAIKTFLACQIEKISKHELFQFIKTPSGSLFSKEFFGKCLWTQGVVQESKTNVNVLFRHNLQSFYQAIKNKRINK